MVNSNKLSDKLTAIADGFRASRGTTQEYSLDEMAAMAAEPVGGDDGNNAAVALLQGDVAEITDENFPGLEALAGGLDWVTKINHSTLKRVGSFYNASATVKIQSVVAPNLTTLLGGGTFRVCKYLERFVGGNVGTVTQSCFESSTKLAFADFGGIGTISKWAFWGTALNTLVIRGDNVPALVSTDAFDGSPFAAGKAGGTVYVKGALIEQYKTATNWGALYEGGSCAFAAIEGSEYE